MKNYTPLFLQGGAQHAVLDDGIQLLKNEAAFLNTGTWSKKAIEKRKFFRRVMF